MLKRTRNTSPQRRFNMQPQSIRSRTHGNSGSKRPFLCSLFVRLWDSRSSAEALSSPLRFCGVDASILKNLMRGRRRIVADNVRFAVAQIEALGLLMIQRTGAATAKYRQLVAALVDGAIAIHSLGNCESWTFGAIRGDQFWSRTRAEAVRIR